MPEHTTEPSTLILLSSATVSDPAAVKALTAKFSGPVHRQVLDRLTEGMVKLPDASYNLIYIAPGTTGLAGAASTLETLAAALVPGGVLRGGDLSVMDAIMAGLVEAEDKTGFMKPQQGVASVTKLGTTSSAPRNGAKKRPFFKRPPPQPTTASQNIVKLSLTDLDDDDDDDLVDENSLLGSTLSKPIVVPQKCQPSNGVKRRKACKDCTCGLKELELQELEAKRKAQSGTVVTLNLDEEIDFTVQGKTGGSCGSCALGDAFRCDGCPYLGLPPFRPGEIITVGGMANDF